MNLAHVFFYYKRPVLILTFLNFLDAGRYESIHFFPEEPCLNKFPEKFASQLIYNLRNITLLIEWLPINSCFRKRSGISNQTVPAIMQVKL